MRTLLWLNFIYNFKKLFNLKDKYRRIKWFWQRGKNGYADCDIWSLDDYINGWLPEALRRLAETSHGYPMSIHGRHRTENEKSTAWSNILYTIADGLEANQKLIDVNDWYDSKDRVGSDKRRRILEKKSKRAFKLLEKHYNSLWD